MQQATCLFVNSVEINSFAVLLNFRLMCRCHILLDCGVADQSLLFLHVLLPVSFCLFFVFSGPCLGL